MEVIGGYTCASHRSLRVFGSTFNAGVDTRLLLAGEKSAVAFSLIRAIGVRRSSYILTDSAVS